MEKKRPWLIENVIGVSDTVLLSGRIDAAKTTVAAGWAMAVATGISWRGRAVTRGSVLYLARPTEAGRMELESAACVYAAAAASRLNEIPITVICTNQLDLTPRADDRRRGEDAFFDALAWHRKKHGSLSLVVIDTISDYFHDDLFAPDVVDKVLSVVDAISKAYNCAVVLIFDMEPGDAPAKETLIRLEKASDVHYVYRVPQSRQAASPDEILYGTLLKSTSGKPIDNKRLTANIRSQRRQKSKTKVQEKCPN